MAFMLMLESLGPVERAVFLLREVFATNMRTHGSPMLTRARRTAGQIVRRAKAQLDADAAPSTPPTAQAQHLVSLPRRHRQRRCA